MRTRYQIVFIVRAGGQNYSDNRGISLSLHQIKICRPEPQAVSQSVVDELAQASWTIVKLGL